MLGRELVTGDRRGRSTATPAVPGRRPPVLGRAPTAPGPSWDVRVPRRLAAPSRVEAVSEPRGRRAATALRARTAR
eukprot:1065067-Prymnesium_polylepis.1